MNKTIIFRNIWTDENIFERDSKKKMYNNVDENHCKIIIDFNYTVVIITNIILKILI